MEARIIIVYYIRVQKSNKLINDNVDTLINFSSHRAKKKRTNDRHKRAK